MTKMTMTPEELKAWDNDPRKGTMTRSAWLRERGVDVAARRREQRQSVEEKTAATAAARQKQLDDARFNGTCPDCGEPAELDGESWICEECLDETI